MPATVATPIRIDRRQCELRLERQIERLSAPPYTSEAGAVTRYAFTAPYMRTLDHISMELERLGFDVGLDSVGNLVARNCPADRPAIGLGSHCDSVRHGGQFDGILGVLAAIEVARCGVDLGLSLPLQIVSWVEEEASGFGQMLLGSRVAAGLLDPVTLRDLPALDDGRTFVEHARDAGLDIDRTEGHGAALAGMSAWIELHIEQGRVLEDAARRIGVVEAIAGYVHADLELTGRADHAGATPMGKLRRDAAVAAAAIVLAAERIAMMHGAGAVATVGELTVEPGAINIIPGRAKLSVDLRAPDQDTIDRMVRDLTRTAAELARARHLTLKIRERQRVAPVILDHGVLETFEMAARSAGVPWRRMISGAAHDTMCVAPHVPSAMILIPCRDGISHSPAECAAPADAAVGIELMVNAALELSRR